MEFIRVMVAVSSEDRISRRVVCCNVTLRLCLPLNGSSAVTFCQISIPDFKRNKWVQNNELLRSEEIALTSLISVCYFHFSCFENQSNCFEKKFSSKPSLKKLLTPKFESQLVLLVIICVEVINYFIYYITTQW